MAKKQEASLTIDVLSVSGSKVSDLTLNGEVFSIAPHSQSMFDAAQVALSNARQNNAKSKTKSEVAGSGIKPWRQKGTGRARAGMKRSPVWVGGGVTFGPTGKENYVLGQNKKQYRLAFRSALSEKFLEKKLAIVDDLAFKNGRTKEALTMLKALKLTGKILLVGETLNDQVSLAVRNLPKVMYVSRQQLSAVDIMNADVLVIAKPAVS
ncbi:MAG: 50S ribosomal protein L4, partial [Bacilli bacterium]